MAKDLAKKKKPTNLPAELAIANDQLSFAPSFQATLAHISETVDHAKALATVQNLDNLDEDSLVNVISDLSEAQTLARNVNKTRRDLKRYLKGRSDKIVNQFDNALNQAHFDELASYDAKAKDLKKELSAYRVNKRWEEIKDVFDANLANYPIIHELAPSLESFDTFRVRHPKLVSGAKSWKFGDKQMQALNQDLFDMNDCLTDLKTNDIGLKPNYQNMVLQEFIKNPVKTHYLETKDKIFTQQKRDEQAALAAKKRQEELEKQRQAAEKARLEEQKAQKAAQAAQAALAAQNQAITQKQQQEAAQKQREALAAQKRAQDMQAKQLEMQRQQQEAAQKQQMLRNNARDAGRKWLADFVAVNYKYRNIAGNDQVKATLIFDLIHALDNPTSDFYMFIHQDEKAANSLLLSVLKQIIDV